ncbi:MAG TPA: hypothetical protein VJX67_13225, partial [Blastocatellia bacterium]|nr:hypothetical protein [Blastocatellia bacterium]
VLRERDQTAVIELIRIDSAEHAATLMFLGSPTIQIDGVDLESTLAADLPVGLCCRVYRQGMEASGSPTKEMVQRALEARARRPVSPACEENDPIQALGGTSGDA